MNWFTATDPSMPYNEQDVNAVVGSAGPYYISSREIGRSLVLERNPNYKGTRPANPDRIVVTVDGDQNQSLLQVKAGQADYDPRPAAAAAGPLGEEFGVNKSRYFVKPTSVTVYWALNNQPGRRSRTSKLPQGGQLGDRPAGAGARLPASSVAAAPTRSCRRRCPGFLQSNNLYAFKGANVAKAKAVAGDVGDVPRDAHRHGNSTANVNRADLRYNLEQMGFKAKTEADPERAALRRAPATRRATTTTCCAAGWIADYPDPSTSSTCSSTASNIPTEDVATTTARPQQHEVQRADGQGARC